MSGMLDPVELGARPFEEYEPYLERGVALRIRRAAERLRGKRVLHINSTSSGGGVAEMLRSEIPVLRGLGIDAHWRVMTAPPEFFEVSKRIHNGLQGNPVSLDDRAWDIYEEQNRRLSQAIDPHAWDVIQVHDPQPCAALSFMDDRGRARWIWRCHIDSSRPNQTYAKRFRAYSEFYDAHVYSLAEYALDGMGRALHLVPPSIDPLSEKSRPMAEWEARDIVRGFGVDVESPLVAQVSRFDPWKDPVGVLEAFRDARSAVPGLQLALIGAGADDDPESKTVLEEVLAASGDDPDVHVLANRCDDRAVKAFQTHSQAVVQKSIREGFGLTVSEALWCSTPVIGGRAGGIPLQILDGRTGLLVETVRHCADAIVSLVTEPQRARRYGENGREHVRRNFLLPRLIEDEMRMWDQERRTPVPGIEQGRPLDVA